MTIEQRTMVQKRGTADEWALHDDVLLEGQLGVLVQPGPDILKVGDGVTPFSGLPAITGGGGDDEPPLVLVAARVGGSFSIPKSATSPWNLIPLTVVTDSESGWDATNSWYVIPEDGVYDVTAAIRVGDGVASGKNFGVGVDSFQGDSERLFWYTTGSTRNTFLYTRQTQFYAGQQVRLFAYNESGADAPVTNASLGISRAGHGAVTGPAGPKGDPGATGAAGTSYTGPKITASATAPSSPAAGDIWIDTSTTV